jgi:hypothetical protein
MPYLQSAKDTRFDNSTLNDVAGNQYNSSVTNVYSKDDRATLAVLEPAERGRYSVPRCMEGTRESIFMEIDAWLHDFGAPNSIIREPRAI